MIFILMTLQHLQKFQQRELKAHKQQRVEQVKEERVVRKEERRKNFSENLQNRKMKDQKRF